MSEPKIAQPLLEGLILGEPISDHHGVRCCPAIREDTNERYIVKIISIPAAQVQLDALLLTGACSDEQQALAYFKDRADDAAGEVDILERLSHLEGFAPCVGHEVRRMEQAVGYDVCLLTPYRRSLERLIFAEPLTHLAAVNLGLDMCAALSVCRQAGYLYVDLKPENIFRSETQGFQIGDLGFIPLSSLKYASLPEKYRSYYTAPEICDALSELNDTMDIYALGLILYRIYNNGQFPSENMDANGSLPTPMYADYEMAEIILKACAPNPSDRWATPAQMGQALVDYMQRNSINDTPIIPAPIAEEMALEEPEGFITEEENAENLDALLAMIPDEVEPQQLSLDPDLAAEPELPPEEMPQEEPAAEEASEVQSEQLSFLDNAGLHESGVTNEVAKILAHADDLIAHELPEPVVAPAAIDIPIPAPIVAEPEEEVVEEGVELEEVVPVASEEEEEKELIPVESFDEDEEEILYGYEEKPKPRRWIAALIAAVMLLIAGIGISIWYNHFYLQTVEFLQVNGSADSIAVTVVTDIDESLLTVVCTDTYGNSRRSPLSNGTAIFQDLNPATQYRIRLEISGMHKLVGQTTGTYTTDNETQILDFYAICGPEDGSAILKFSLKGPTGDQWTIVYSAPGESAKSHVLTGTTTTIYDLVPGTEYTFRLLGADGLRLTGTTEFTYTAEQILVAKDLAVTDCGGGSLRVQWNAPEAPAGQKWIVRCYNNAGYDRTTTVTDYECTFTELDHSVGYTILVTAEGMPKSAETSVSADPLIISGFTATVVTPWTVKLEWSYTGTPAEDGWILSYRINSGDLITVLCAENQAEISVTPGCTYEFAVSAPDGTDCFGPGYTYGPVETQSFEGYGVTAGDMSLSTVLRPGNENWSYLDLTEEDYRANFTSGENVSLVLHMSTTYAVSNNLVTITYIVRDHENQVINIDNETITWRNMWYQRYCELDPPVIPTNNGTYTIDLYFNDLFVGSLSFVIEEAIS